LTWHYELVAPSVMVPSAHGSSSSSTKLAHSGLAHSWRCTSFMPARALPSPGRCEVLRSLRRVATGGTYGLAPRCQQREQLVEVVTQRPDHDGALPVGGHLDVLAHSTAEGGEPAVVDQLVLAQMGLRHIELRAGPGAGAHVRAQWKAPVQLGEQADLGGLEPGGDPRCGVRVAA